MASLQSIGIVIRTKDRPQFLSRAIGAVLAQSYTDWHVVIVNDGGDKAMFSDVIAPEGVSALPDGQSTILDLDEGVGRAQAFNLGVEALETDFVTCLDDDDTWEPEFLAALIAFYNETAPKVSQLGGVAAQVTAILEDVVVENDTIRIERIGEDTLARSFSRGEFFLHPLAYACYRQDLYPVQWMLKRDAVLSTGGFPVEFDVMEDRAFMNRFLAHWRVALLDRKLAFHHRRVNRFDDRARSVLMNTLDNPSYDWRQFDELARPYHDPVTEAAQAALFRSVAAEMLSEINFETSAIWKKVDGEMAHLSQIVSDGFSRLSGSAPNALAINEEPPEQQVSATTQPDAQAPAVEPSLDAPAFDIWTALEKDEYGMALSVGTYFAPRLLLSQNFAQDGRLVHVSRAARQITLQLPETRNWSAIEIGLDGLAGHENGLLCQLHLTSTDGFLFQTALTYCTETLEDGPRYRVVEHQVHHCLPSTGCDVVRRFAALDLARGDDAKLSIILPRHAMNFRVTLKSLTITSATPPQKRKR